MVAAAGETAVREEATAAAGDSDDRAATGWYGSSAQGSGGGSGPAGTFSTEGTGQAFEKGEYREAIYALVGDRTEFVDEKFVRELDERNRARMACLPPWVQKHVVYTYAPREGGTVRDPNRFFSGVIGGVRRLVQSGMTEEESARLIHMAKGGVRVSYMPCVAYGRRGTCVYGDKCKNVHVRGITG